ncbi:hypothetical protein EVAR_63054_1 [Eumeta japonica]|uniref:Nucleic-acid-binding protein from transposon X-element n=1 Tax=Eumeta variegata TaxID=151549 RepID=A0A4C1Z8Z4_EUMVA|nr:hypothetical protein EVAR_63054_1 [Eumeta japonica]
MICSEPRALAFHGKPGRNCYHWPWTVLLVDNRQVTKGKNKRQASSSSSDEELTCSDSTVVGKESESEKSETSFTLVKRKNKRALKKARVARSQPAMGIDPSPATTSAQVVLGGAPKLTGTKPTAPLKLKAFLSIFLRKGANFVKISADYLRLPINYSKAVRVDDNDIQILCTDVETFRSLNKYLVDNKVQFYTYALEEEHKLKVVILGIPADFAVNDIKADLNDQEFPVYSMHRIVRRDGPPLWRVLAVLPKICYTI